MNLLTANEVAQILRVPPARVYELARRKMIPALTLGQKQLRFEESALRDWIAAGGSGSPFPPFAASARES
jgi:excisionase family DNA binding protein